MTLLSITILLFLIALRMVFPSADSPLAENTRGEPFLVPLALERLMGLLLVALAVQMSIEGLRVALRP